MTNDYESFFKDDPWSELAGPSYPEGRQLYLNDDRFWVSKNQHHQIQFFVHEKEIIEVKNLENLAGVEINISKYNSRSSRLICTLMSDEKDMKEKFSVVVKDVSYHCSKYEGTQLFLNVQNRIKSWAYFLKPTRSGLSHSEFVGFWGELYSISHIFMKHHTPADVIRFWIGPEGKKQDIILNSIAVEVKTSMSGDPQVVRISSLDQLVRVTESLYLLHIIASPSNNEHGFSLENLYNNCMEYLSQDLNAETIFLHKVSKTYGKANDSQLNDKFAIVSISLFDVRDGFPLISRNDVNHGIASAQYEIFTSYIKEFEVTEDIERIVKNG